jgi:hypothetical protein
LYTLKGFGKTGSVKSDMKKMNFTMLCIKLTVGLSLTCSTLLAADSLEQKTKIDYEEVFYGE